MDYIRLTISIKDEFQELLIAELFDLDFEGFQEEDDVLIATIPASEFDDYTREEIEQFLMSFGEDAHIMNEEIIPPQNWNQNWEQSIEPQYVGKFYVRPTWSDPSTDEGIIDLLIDPKMAFGTGYHGTTRMILEWLPDLIRKGDKVLDAGTGTGILGIAALKLGAASAFGFDIDEWSEHNAAENIELNKVDNFEVKLGSTEVIPDDSEFDVILANINRNALIQLIPELLNYLKKGGYLLLSGLLKEDEIIMRELESVQELTFIKTHQQKEWISILFEK